MIVHTSAYLFVLCVRVCVYTDGIQPLHKALRVCVSAAV